MHYRYRGSIVHSVPSPRYYREILPIPTELSRLPRYYRIPHYRVILYFERSKLSKRMSDGILFQSRIVDGKGE